MSFLPAKAGASTFGGEIIDGKLYGRGTIDNKDRRWQFSWPGCFKESAGGPGRIRLILGCDEESDWSACAITCLAESELPLPDAEFPVINSERHSHGGIIRELQTPKERTWQHPGGNAPTWSRSLPGDTEALKTTPPGKDCRENWRENGHYPRGIGNYHGL